jgi:hypothetical protein
MAIRSLHGLSANFALTPPLFKPPRYGPDDKETFSILVSINQCNKQCFVFTTTFFLHHVR